MTPTAEPVYLDYNATAPLLPAAGERMVQVLREVPGNPSSPHAFGQAARAVLESERARLAELLGVERRDVIFTSGGSESNTMLFRGCDGDPRAHVITSPIEHPSVLRACEWLQQRGVAVSYLPVDGQGRVSVEALPELMRPETRLVSVMAANNETGVLQPIARLVELARAQGSQGPVLVHTDATQAFGRVPLPLAEWGVDAATIAAHKLGGPKGVGALVLAGGKSLPGLILGGRQERGLRAGTESVFLAAGFAAAAAWTLEHMPQASAHIAALRDRLVNLISAERGFFLNGADAPRLPNTANLGFEGVSAQSLLVALDLAGFAISTGSACSSGAVEPSHVLQAMGLSAARVGSSVRISLGPGNSEADVERCAEAMLFHVARLRSLGRKRVS